ncbi:MAG: DinB family protein [Gemmatimonadota bacterium]
MSTAAHWIQELENVSRDVERTFGPLDGETLHRKPEDGGWSIAECLEHLVVSNTSYFPIFQQLTEGEFKTPLVGRIGLIRSFFGNLIFKSVADGRKKKVKTFAIWEPRGGEGESEVVSDFLKHQAEFTEWIRRLEPWIQSEAVIHSPVSPMVVYTLPKGLEILVAHEQRHVEQARLNLP